MLLSYDHSDGARDDADDDAEDGNQLAGSQSRGGGLYDEVIKKERTATVVRRRRRTRRRTREKKRKSAFAWCQVLIRDMHMLCDPTVIVLRKTRPPYDHDDGYRSSSTKYDSS